MNVEKWIQQQDDTFLLTAPITAILFGLIDYGVGLGRGRVA